MVIKSTIPIKVINEVFNSFLNQDGTFVFYEKKKKKKQEQSAIWKSHLQDLSWVKTYSRWQIPQIGGINDIFFDLSAYLWYSSPSKSSCDFVHGWFCNMFFISPIQPFLSANLCITIYFNRLSIVSAHVT